MGFLAPLEYIFAILQPLRLTIKVAERLDSHKAGERPALQQKEPSRAIAVQSVWNRDWQTPAIRSAKGRRPELMGVRGQKSPDPFCLGNGFLNVKNEVQL